MSEVITGHVTSVETRNLAEPTTASAAVGDTVLQVGDAATFDENGGLITLQGAQVAYVSINVDTNTITLAAALTVDVDEQELVEVVPPTPVKTATVVLDGGGDQVTATVPHALLDKFPDGLRTDVDAESVTLERRGAYEQVLSDAVAQPLTQVSLDYVEAEAGIGLSTSVAQVQDVQALGVVAAPTLTADTITLGGVDLASQLSASSIGKILSARLPQQGSSIACTTTLTKIFELNCGTVRAGRTYRVATSMLLDGAAPLALTDRVSFTYRYTLDGSTPTTASPYMDGGFNDNYGIFGDFSYFRPEAEVDISADSLLRVALCVQVMSGGGSYAIYAGASARSRPVMMLYDDGPSGARNDLAISLAGGGTSRFVKTYSATWAYGVANADGMEALNSYLYIGSVDDFFGYVGFDSTSMVAQLANASTPVSCVLRWRPRTRKTGGLDIRVASHNFGSAAAAKSACGGFPSFAYANASTYGITLLSNVRNNTTPGTLYEESLGLSVFNQFKAGTRKGVAFVGVPEASGSGGEGSIYGDGSYEMQLVFTYDGLS